MVSQIDPLARIQIGLQNYLWPNSNYEEGAAAGQDLEQRYELFLDQQEGKGFPWLVYLVTASGFFTDSYNLFASNVILPALGYVYWKDSYGVNSLAFDLATLGASAVGQLLFGFLADSFGRRSLYGLELIIVIISTLGLLQCSTGYVDGGDSTWTIGPWIFFWRSVMGIGIGAEYPLSACIAAEWSPTKWRSRTMSAVFLMQPVGQLCAYCAGLIGLQIYPGTPLGIDRLWRWVIGLGVIPTVLALVSRISMPEGGMYHFEVIEKAQSEAALADLTNAIATRRGEGEEDIGITPAPPERMWNFLYRQGHWRYLAGTSACWFLLDFVFYGIGFNNPSVLSRLWSPNPLEFPPGSPGWLTNSGVQNATDLETAISKVLQVNMTHAIYTVSIASIIGLLCMVAFIDYFHRKHMLTGTFAILGVLLVIVAASFEELFHHPNSHNILIVFWIAISFLFSFGPNTLCYIIPAEAFPTRYRCSLYGVSAASGKTGALLAQIAVHWADLGQSYNGYNFRWTLLGFGSCMFLGALCSHFTLPSVQTMAEKPPPWYQNKPLRDLPPPPQA